MTLRTGLTAPKKRVRWRIRWQTRRPRDGCSSLPMTTCVWLRGRRHERRASRLDQREEANPLQRGWDGADGDRVLPKLFWPGYALVTSVRKNWSEHERAEIGRLEAVCSETNHWSLDCDHTDAGDPWCVICDHQHHRIGRYALRGDKSCTKAVAEPRKRPHFLVGSWRTRGSLNTQNHETRALSRVAGHEAASQLAGHISGAAHMAKRNFIFDEGSVEAVERLRKQDEEFCRRLRVAVERGNEFCPTTVITAPARAAPS